MTNVFSIISAISGFLIAVTAILATLKKVRSWFVNKFISDLEFKKVDKRSELYSLYEKIEKSEERNSEIIGKIDQMSQKLQDDNKEIRMATIRLELGRLLDHEPKNKDTIYMLYDKYIALGGNSYMVSRIEHWKKEYCE